MSGTFSNILSAAGSLANSVGSFLFGAGDQPVSLGDFVFQGWEVPEAISWGGFQRMTVHKFPGGDRIIDAMGRDDDEITWSGIFLSEDASDRADELDQLRIAGDELELIFAGRNYSVVISQFKADQRKINYVPYTISCTVLVDESGSIGNGDSPSLLSSVTSDINDALGFDLSGTLGDVQSAIQQVQGPILTATSLVAGGPAAAKIAGVLGSAQGVLSGAKQLANGSIGGLTTLAISTGNITGANTVSAAISGLQTAATLTRQVSTLTATGGFLDRAAKNLFGG